MKLNLYGTLVDAYGRRVVAAGGEAAHKQIHHKGWTISLEWWRDTDLNTLKESLRFERVMCIWPTLHGPESGVWAIADDAKVNFCRFGSDDKPTGTPTPYALLAAREALVVTFGRPALDVEVHGLVAAILHAMPEFVLMPPAPVEAKKAHAREALWEVQRKEDGTVVGEASV
jgi:hypothetical protein